MRVGIPRAIRCRNASHKTPQFFLTQLSEHFQSLSGSQYLLARVAPAIPEVAGPMHNCLSPTSPPLSQARYSRPLTARSSFAQRSARLDHRADPARGSTQLDRAQLAHQPHEVLERGDRLRFHRRDAENAEESQRKHWSWLSPRSLRALCVSAVKNTATRASSTHLAEKASPMRREISVDLRNPMEWSGLRDHES